MKILTAAQMQEIDRLSTEAYGVPSLTLMENAGFHLFLELQERFDDLPSRDIAIICGKGNNGGDGMVLARQLLQRGIVPDVFLLAQRKTVKGDAAVNLDILSRWGLPIFEITTQEAWDDVASRLELYDVIVDAILGTGIAKPLKGLYREVVRDINQCDAFVLSVDIPSGMHSDAVEAAEETVWANATVTFTAPKVAHLLNRDLEAIGELSIVPIGTPPQLLDDPAFTLNALTLEEVSQLYLHRSADSHKGTYGHAVLIAAGEGKSGAAILSSYAALRAGAGLVTAFVPKNVQGLVAGYTPEIMTEGFQPTVAGTFSNAALKEVLQGLQGKDVAGIGPGISTHPETVEFARALVRQSPVPLVIDADGLNAFADTPHQIKNAQGRPIILTPHPGEFSRLTGRSVGEIANDPVSLVKSFSKEHGLWLVLKSFRTLIGTPEGQVFVSTEGNPGMATAGMGDVLTGILTSLVGQFAAQQRDDSEAVTSAVCLGVFLHGLAGNAAAQENGWDSLVAGDVIDCLSEAFELLLGE